MKSRQNSAPQEFLKGAAVLLAALALVKIMGALFKIPLNAVIGDVGMGYFGTAYMLYNPIFCLATAGLPVAISRMVSQRVTQDRMGEAVRIRKTAFPVFLAFGIAGFLLMFFGAEPILSIVNPSDLSGVRTVQVLAPAVFFSVLSAVYRGYYEGMRNMKPTAVSQIVEAFVKLFVGLFCAWYILHWTEQEYIKTGAVLGNKYNTLEEALQSMIPYASAEAVLGVTLGAMLSLVFLIVYTIVKDKKSLQFLQVSGRFQKPVQSKKSLLGEMVRTAIPIALGALAVNASGLIDTVFLQNALGGLMEHHPEDILSQYGSFFSAEEIRGNRLSTALFGCYTNAMTLFMLVPAVTQTFGVSALPNVTAVWVSGNREELEKTVEKILRASVLFTLPAGIFLSVFSESICTILGFNPVSGKILIILGLASIFAAVSTPVCSILQALGRGDIPLKLLSIGLGIKILLNLKLTGLPQVNLLGAGIASLVCYFFVTFGGIYEILKLSSLRLHLGKVVGRPFFAAAFGAALGHFAEPAIKTFLPAFPAHLLILSIGALGWAAACLFFGIFPVRIFFKRRRVQKVTKILEKRPQIR